MAAGGLTATRTAYRMASYRSFKTYAGLRFGPPTAEGQARWETGEGVTAFYQKAETTYWLMTASAAQLDAVRQEMELP